MVVAPRFDHADWQSFAGSAAISLAVYLFTLIPDVSFGSGGAYVTAAKYWGVSSPPGYPLWTLYAWLFVHGLPVSNIAWRVAAASAIAAAVSCGLVAMIVSRGSLFIIRVAGNSDLPVCRAVRVTCGMVSGLGLGFSSPFWRDAVLPGPWPLTICMTCLVMALLTRWTMRPEQKRYLFIACVAYGLTLTNSQILGCLVPAVPFLMLAASLPVSRDLFVAMGCCVSILLFAAVAGIPVFPFPDLSSWIKIILVLGAVFEVMVIALIVATRAVLTQWTTVLAGAGCFVAGLSLYLFVPLASMANPPINWAYPRTVGGFIHVVSRGQFEVVRPVQTLSRFSWQCSDYIAAAARDFGWPYLAAVVLVLISLWRLPAWQRTWLAGYGAAFMFLSFFMICVLNPEPGEAQNQIIAEYYSASYVPLSILAGHGLCWVACRVRAS